MNSKAKGEISEAVILAHLVKLGYVVLLPFGNNQRYDMVVDKGDGTLIKAQCKTGRYRKGSVVFNACSQNGFTHSRMTYKGQIDVFLVYCAELDEVYEIPVNEASSTETRLRILPPKNNHVKDIKYASEFMI